MSGFIKLHRDTFDNSLLDDEKFSRREAWMWLIASACWKPKKVFVKGREVPLERGQLAYSIRYLAEAWNWEQTRVLRYMKTLQTHNMVRRETATGVSVITICNYNKYQDDARQCATAAQQQPQQERNSSATNKKKDKKEKKKEYYYEGEIIKLNAKDYERWRESYSCLDLRAELTGLDDYYRGEDPEKVKNWFSRASAALAKKNAEAQLRQQATAAKSEEQQFREWFPTWDNDPEWIKDERRKRGKPAPV